MEKRTIHIGLRPVVSLICAIAALGLVVSMLPVMFLGQTGDLITVYEAGQEKITDNYALYIYDQFRAGNEEELTDFLGQTNMDVSIVKVENSLGADVPEEEKTSLVYSFSQVELDIDEGKESTEVETNPQVDKEPQIMDFSKAHKLEIYEGTAYNYNVNSLFQAMRTSINASEDLFMVPTKVTEVVYDINTGIFYYKTAQGYYEVTYIYINEPEASYDYRLVTENDKKYYYNDFYDRILDKDTYTQWQWVDIEDSLFYFNGYGDITRQIAMVEDSQVIADQFRDDYYYVTGDMMLYYSDVNAVDKYEIYITLHEPDALLSKDGFANEDLFAQWREFMALMSKWSEHTPMLLVTFSILLLLGIALLAYAAPKKAEELGFFHKLPVITYSGIITIIVALFLAMTCLLIEEEIMYGRYYLPEEVTITLAIILALLGLWIGFGYLGNIIARIKTQSLFRYSEFYYISRPFIKIRDLARDNIPFFWKAVVVVLVITLIEFMTFVVGSFEPNVILFLWFIVKFVEIPLVLYVFLQLEILHEGSKRIAQGDINTPIDTSKLKWEFKKHGENLNSVSESISLAVDKQLKSERFKTELITNVSHDIKTPLTSIINYVDLLKKEDLTDETVCEYIDVLDRQSARLKKLIEDLMEASKASTGNLPVQFEECDIQVLMTQIIGEFEDKLIANELELIVDKPEVPVKIKADGRHMWRVLDNLMINACKYAQPHTRVYVSLKKEGEAAIITFKNISKAPLNIPSDELIERFVRGDSSRNTEGSGLGLSIAQSLTELMNGSMKLDIDGDLFKVTLKFRAL